MKTKLQILVTTFFGMLSSLLGTLYVPVLLMVATNIIDYITGLAAAPYRNDGGISSYKSIRGIKKKVAMWLLVVVGAIVDQLITYTTELLGWKFPVTFLVACLVAVWIICNELISILENMHDIGMDLPPWLLPLIKNIKSKSEDVVYTEEDDNGIHNEDTSGTP
ncbi:MAG: phage holin family protein [Eubacterium sp.]|nr:phage holin family protein [Eubacterium sp.]